MGKTSLICHSISDIIHLGRVKRAFIHLLPCEKPSSPSVVSLSTQLRLHENPFYRMASSPCFSAPSRPLLERVYVGKDFASFELEERSLEPQASSRVVCTEKVNGSIADSLGHALETTGVSSSFTVLKLDVESRVAAILYTPDEGAITSPIDLLVFAPAVHRSRTVDLTLPQTESLTPRCLLQPERAAVFLPLHRDKINLRLPVEAIVHQMSLFDFVELRESDIESILLCAPAARFIEVGEKDCADLSKYTPSMNVDTPSIVYESKVDTSGTRETTPELESSTIRLIASSRENGDGLQKGSKSGSVWLLSIIGQFFMDLWSLFSASFGGGAIQLPERDQIGEVDEDEDEVEEAHTPTNDRTPLLEVRFSKPTYHIDF